MLKKIIGATLTIVLTSVLTFAADSTTHTGNPHSLYLQYAGNTGLISFAAGRYIPDKRLNSHLVYGYLPASVNGVTVHTLALKVSCRIADTRVAPDLFLQYYIGLTTLYGVTRNTYLNYPDYFPDKYYASNAFHVSPYLGFHINALRKNSHQDKVFFFTELGAIDYKLWSAITTKYVGLSDILNISFGIGFTIH